MQKKNPPRLNENRQTALPANPNYPLTVNDSFSVMVDSPTTIQSVTRYPKKDSASAYRQSSENDWNALSVEDKRKAIAYIQTNRNDGSATFNDMFLSQFLKRKPWC